MFGTPHTFEHLRQELNRKREFMQNKGRIKVVKTSCLGQCANGPIIFIVPDNIWYTFSCIEDIDELIDCHFIKGKIAKRLVNSRINYE